MPLKRAKAPVRDAEVDAAVVNLTAVSLAGLVEVVSAQVALYVRNHAHRQAILTNLDTMRERLRFLFPECMSADCTAVARPAARKRPATTKK